MSNNRFDRDADTLSRAAQVNPDVGPDQSRGVAVTNTIDPEWYKKI